MVLLCNLKDKKVTFYLIFREKSFNLESVRDKSGYLKFSHFLKQKEGMLVSARLI